MSKVKIEVEEERKFIFGMIDAERKYQNDKWGTDFDDKNTVNDWHTYVNWYLTKASEGGEDVDRRDLRAYFIKSAALAVAALEALNRNKKFADRHYDKKKGE